MSLVVIVTGSPSAPSRTQSLALELGNRLRADKLDVEVIQVRDLPPDAVLHARFDAPALKDALALVERADAVVVATPLYKASYAGVLKAFLDLLPQAALGGKVVLPLATGGTVAHFLALDYGLRPVLQSLGDPHVLGSVFVLDKQLERKEDGTLLLADEVRQRIDAAAADLRRALRA